MWPGHGSELLALAAPGDLEWPEEQGASEIWSHFYFLLFGPHEVGRRLSEQGLDPFSLSP